MVYSNVGNHTNLGINQTGFAYFLQIGSDCHALSHQGFAARFNPLFDQVNLFQDGWGPSAPKRNVDSPGIYENGGGARRLGCGVDTGFP